jgi:hypothetical protein
MGEIIPLPTIEIRTVAPQGTRRPVNGRPLPPGRKSNAEHGRTREWLSEAEIEKLMTAAADG